METLLTSMAVYIPVVAVLEILSVLFSLLFMHYSAKYRNQQLSAGWYVCGILFGFWTIIVFLIKRKDFPGEDAKVCAQCGDVYLKDAVQCPKCGTDLPEANADEKRKQKKLSRIFGAAIVVTFIVAVAVGIIFGVVFSEGVIDDELLDENYRIAVNGVYYDKMGNSYEDETEVLLYDEEGRIYTYTLEEVADKEDDFFSYEEEYYVRDDGKKYLIYDCYVTHDGWFYCDKAYELEMYSPDTSTMTEEELDAYYESNMELYEADYKYYDYPYADEEGNLYYDAFEASWNEKGELITAENDSTK
ncbi:MAG: hypothetical protein IKL41_04225 [Clostridia bacterium]|nr:hypothetical protein [Clostridia bacterium]MBR6634815.1 hypothetical protein [Clostridia bacterium]